MANIRTIGPKQTRIITPIEYLRAYGYEAWTEKCKSRPHMYAKIVQFRDESGNWQDKGWLMPQVEDGSYKTEEMINWVDCERVNENTWYLGEPVS